MFDTALFHEAPHDLPEDYLRALIDSANANAERNDGANTPIKEIIEGSEVVFAIWRDMRRHYGVDFLLLKGVNKLREIAAMADDNLRGVAISTNAILMDNREMALAAREVFGQPDHLN
jgi:hypothetical protein